MNKTMLDLLRSTPSSGAMLASRLPCIMDGAGTENLPAAQASIGALVKMGLVECQRVPRDWLYSRTPEGDKVARTGRFE